MVEEGRGGGLGFERVERAGLDEGERDGVVCALCSQPVRAVYFELAGRAVCAPCRGRTLTEREGGSRLERFARATVCGLGAAILGSLLWYTVSRLTGYEFGLLAIVIGLMVGGAVRFGSRRRGGWAYQTLAMFLTYAAIVSTYIPPILEEIRGGAQTEAAGGPAAADPAGADAGSRVAPVPVVGQPTAAPVREKGGLVVENRLLARLLGYVLLFAFACAAPFLAGLENFMGWIILAIGLYEAWKLNRRDTLVFNGPFRVQGAAAPPWPELPPPPIAP